MYPFAVTECFKDTENIINMFVHSRISLTDFYQFIFSFVLPFCWGFFCFSGRVFFVVVAGDGKRISCLIYTRQ